MQNQIAFKNLIRIACHDISNPLTLILGTAQIAESGVFDSKPEKLKELWPKIIRATETVNRTLVNMRAYESIQVPKRISIQEIDSEALMSDLKVSFIDASNLAKVKVNYAMNSPHKRFPGDVLLLKQACFSCLIHHGIRFSEPDSEVFVDAEFTEDRFIFTVKNETKSILQETLESLYKFDFVERPEQPVGAKEGGFSLAVCKLVIEHFGGELSISKENNDDKPPTIIAKLTLPLNAT